MVTATTGYTEKDVQVGALKLHYQEWGDPAAPPILMLHGFGVSGHMFDEFAQRAADRYHLIALDQRGHGDSDWSDEGDYTREAFVGDIEGFRQALGIDQFYLVGHSMGGINAVTYAVRNPSRVKALVLVDVGPESAKEGVENIVRFTRGPDMLEFDEFVEMAHRFNPRRSMENIRDRMRHRLKPAENGKWTWKFDSRFREKNGSLRIGSEMSNDETWQLFRSLTTPTLLVRGAESDVLTQDVAERAVREMPNARLALISGAGHSVPGDNPDDFSGAALQFLQDVENGDFHPTAVEDPTLDELVESNGHRRPGLIALVAAGAAVVLAAGGVAFFMRRRRREKGRREQLLRRSRSVARVPSASELDAVRERMTHLAADLSAMGRVRAAEAIQALREADLAPARERAADLSKTARRRATELAAAAPSVDRKKLARRSRRAAALSRTTGAMGLALAGKAISAAMRAQRGRKKRRGRRWRR